MAHEQPALCCTWSADGMKVFSGSCDKSVKAMDLNSGQTMQFIAVSVSDMKHVEKRAYVIFMAYLHLLHTLFPCVCS